MAAGQLRPGSWRSRARDQIRAAIDAHKDLWADPPALFKLINKTWYPFGQRKYLPYTAWRTELGIARDQFARVRIAADGHPTGSPIERTCAACGAKPGRPCKEIGDRDHVTDILEIAADAACEGRTADETEILREAYHEARLASVRRVQLHSGPLFEVP